MLDFKMISRIFVFFSCLFIMSLPFYPYPFSYVLKAIPVFSLALLAFTRKPRKAEDLVMGIGFFFGAIGDIYLDLDREKFFVHGLGAFLIGHLFLASSYFMKRNFNVIRWKYIITAMGLTTTMLYFLVPILGELMIPVLTYITVINLMLFSACMHENGGKLLPLGAFIFLISDSIIAINKFLFPMYLAPVLIMLTYYGGQYLMARALLSGAPQVGKER